ncbi:MAG: DUF4198 domain-containing protein [Armatimonadota bacterium]
MSRLIIRFAPAVAAVLLLAGSACAHDGWIQSNVPRVILGDMCYIDMPFGNHGNTHRDYKVWGSKWDVANATFSLYTPEGQLVDIEDAVIDVGYDEMKSAGGVAYKDVNGYLVASFQPRRKGIYIVDVRQDKVVSYAPERSIKCAKAVVGAVPGSLNGFASSLRGYDRVMSQVVEIVPLNDPTNLAVGDTLRALVLFKGQPLADAHVSVIPRGTELPAMGVENPYDLMTDMDGMISFTFDEANYHLIVVHVETDEGGTLNGTPYQFTKYTGDLTVIVKPTRAGSS